MKILFVCSQNRLRSPTAEAIFSKYAGVDALSAGTNSDCENPVCGDLIEWADAILVMENVHKRKISKKFTALLGNKKVSVLGIPDNFGYMDPALVSLLESRVPRYIRL